MDRHTQRIKPRSITLAFFNADGIRNQRDEVSQFLTEHQVDILLVQETKLSPSIRDPRIANYNLIRNDRPTAAGGTLIYYKRSLHCVPIDPPPLTDMEVSLVRLAMTGHRPILIASAYIPCGNSALRSNFESLFAMNEAVIIGGDFNSKHEQFGCLTTTASGRRLASLADQLIFDVVPPLTPTHYPYNIDHRPDILDMTILKNVGLRLHSIEVIHALNSDHRPVVVQLGPPDSTPIMKTVVDWDKLKCKLEDCGSPQLSSVPDHISSLNEATDAIDALTSHISVATGDSSRQVPMMVNHRYRLPDDARPFERKKERRLP